MQIAVSRHKTAIVRNSLSRPLKLALGDGLLSPETPLFDYGCGRGDDLRNLQAIGFSARGWDPVYRPGELLVSAPVVNLGYVVNVIEDPQERQDTLRQAWSLTERVLIVSARTAIETRNLTQAEKLADGCLTSRGTFQKLFEQHELKIWIEQSLGISALPAGPGIFYVFRREEDRAAFQASRYRRRAVLPRLMRSEVLFNQHQQRLQPLMDFVASRGRLPVDDELPNVAELHEIFGTTKRAFKIIQKATGKEQWEQITEERAQDFLIYLALSRFDGRPSFASLPQDIQLDVKGFFSTYTKACRLADEMLFSVGSMEVVNDACMASQIGKLTPSALYVHESALEHLCPVLRLFEGCARGYIGRVDKANLIKIHRDEPRVSYLSYPEFEADPHPALAFSLTVHLQTFRAKFRSYRDYRNPPILHRKETFLYPEHLLFAKFARLTRIEEAKGLYEDTRRIGMQEGWNRVLEEKGFYLKGHRLLKRY